MRKISKPYFIVFLAVACFWSATLLLSYYLTVNQEKDFLRNFAILEANAHVQEALLFRKWASMRGGIYVKTTGEQNSTPAITTTNGEQMFLMNPSTALRQIHELATGISEIKGRITSLKPMRQENIPDEWESKALNSFNQGATQADTVENINNKSHLRYMKPIIADAECIRCHLHQGYKEGDVLGGASVAIPLEKYELIFRNKLSLILLWHTVCWLLGMAVIYLTYKYILRLDFQTRRERDKFEQIIDTLPVIVLIKDKLGNWLFANKYLCTLLNVDKKDVIGKTDYDFMPSGIADKIAINDNNVLGTQDIFTIEEEWQDGVGEQRFMLSSKKSLMLDDGRMGILSVMSDVTDKIEARRNGAILRKFFKHTKEGMIVTDAKGIITAVNPAFTRISGYESQEVIGKTPSFLKSDVHEKEFFEDIKQQIKKSGTWDGEIYNRHKNGSIYPVWLTITAVKDDSGHIERLIGILIDLTEIKADQQKIKEQNEMLISQSKYAAMGEMISMIAHQWRQPLTAMGMGVNNMLIDLELGEVNDAVFKEHLTLIAGQIQFLSHTIDDFRDFLKPQADVKRMFVIQPINAAVKMIDKQLENNGIALEMQMRCNQNCNSICSSEISVHEGELVQVLLVFLSNAKDALLASGVKEPKIAIRCLRKESTVELSVIDNAGGVPPELAYKMWEPYFTTKGAKNGTGLGLYIAKTITQKHLKGEIGYVNEEDGARFWIQIPLSGGIDNG